MTDGTDSYCSVLVDTHRLLTASQQAEVTPPFPQLRKDVELDPQPPPAQLMQAPYSSSGPVGFLACAASSSRHAAVAR